MDGTETKTILEDPQVMQLLDLLAKNAAKEPYENFSKLLACVTDMEKQLNQTTAELRSVRQELRGMQDSLSKADRTVFSKLVSSLETALRQARRQLDGIKKSIIQAAKSAVRDWKDKGIVGLNSALEAFGIRKALTTLQAHLGRAAKAVGIGITRMEAVRQELQGVGNHVRNIGRVLAGKERREIQTDKAGAALAPLRRLKNAIGRMENLTGRAAGRLEGLERAAHARKPSVREALKHQDSRRAAHPKEHVPIEQTAR